MKRILILLSIAAMALAYTGCKSECKDTVCLNSGTCNDGKCECVGRYGGVNCDTFCPVGYEGNNCEVQNRTKFIRHWTAVTRTTDGASVKHALNVSAGTSVSTVIISNIASQAFSVVGTVGSRTTMDIFEQNATGNYTGKVSGSCVYSERKLTITLTLENGVTYFMECNP